MRPVWGEDESRRSVCRSRWEKVKFERERLQIVMMLHAFVTKRFRHAIRSRQPRVGVYGILVLEVILQHQRFKVLLLLFLAIFTCCRIKLQHADLRTVCRGMDVDTRNGKKIVSDESRLEGLLATRQIAPPTQTSEVNTTT